MADHGEHKNGDQQQPKEDIVLVAQVRAHLINGDSFDLLPFRHEEDVRSQVNDFIEEWANTGFLLRNRFLYPWSQVKAIEAVSVEAMTHAQARPYDEVWQRDAEAHRVFWKTRKPRGQKDKKEEGKGEGGK